MTESYSTQPKKNSSFLKDIGLVLIGAAIPMLVTSVDGWYNRKAEIVSMQGMVADFQGTLATYATSNGEIAKSIDSMNDRLTGIENAIKPVEALEGRMSRAEEHQRTIDAKIQENDARIKALDEKMKFFHSDDGGKERRTLDEWIEEYEKRQKQKQGTEKKRGRFDDYWDGSFNSFRNQEY